MGRFCKTCNKEFSGKTASKYCSEECRQEGRKFNYKNRLNSKSCSNCNTEFKGRDKEIFCQNCKGIRNCKWQEVELPVVCPKCEKQTGTSIRKKTKNAKIIIGPVCQSCKEFLNNERSEKMKSDQNPAIKKWGRDNKIKMTPEEFSNFASERMKGENNPMKRPEIAKKVSEKNKGRCSPKGKDHWLWKGYRNKYGLIRSRLHSKWNRPILERDNFTCQGCYRKGGKLEVHHIDPPFREVVNKILNGRNLKEINDKELEDLVQEVIKIHDNVKGVTLCPVCHSKNDSKRRVSKYESQESNQKEL